jgi:transcriptional regulator with XRE-family HTH domain
LSRDRPFPYVLIANMGLKDVFVKNLRKYRKEKKISQMALAELCGTSTSYIGQIEIGNRFPSIDMIEKIAEALQIRPYMLFFTEKASELTETRQSAKKETLSDAMKDELIKRLTDAVRRVVKRTN